MFLVVITAVNAQSLDSITKTCLKNNVVPVITQNNQRVTSFLGRVVDSSQDVNQWTSNLQMISSQLLTNCNVGNYPDSDHPCYVYAASQSQQRAQMDQINGYLANINSYGCITQQADPANSVADDDNDGLTNSEEQQLGTDINLADTDGDGFSDKVERDAGSDPKNSSSTPAGIFLEKGCMQEKITSYISDSANEDYVKAKIENLFFNKEEVGAYVVQQELAKIQLDIRGSGCTKQTYPAQHPCTLYYTSNPAKLIDLDREIGLMITTLSSSCQKADNQEPGIVEGEFNLNCYNYQIIDDLEVTFDCSKITKIGLINELKDKGFTNSEINSAIQGIVDSAKTFTNTLTGAFAFDSRITTAGKSLGSVLLIAIIVSVVGINFVFEDLLKSYLQKNSIKKTRRGKDE